MTHDPHGAVEPAAEPSSKCPFEVGDRIQSVFDERLVGRVTEIRPTGFCYTLDQSQPLGRVADGVIQTGGEVHQIGFDHWRVLPLGQDPVYRSVDASESGLLERSSFTLSSEPTSFRFVTNQWPVMTITPTHIITIFAEDGSEMVRVERDGTVIVSQHGREPDAARRFWEAMQWCGVDMIGHIRSLEKRLKDLGEKVTPYLSEGLHASA